MVYPSGTGLYGFSWKKAIKRECCLLRLSEDEWLSNLLIAGRVQCADEELTANDGERVEMTCSLRYGGSADAGWRVDWRRSDSGQVLASFGDDSDSHVRRSYLLVAKHEQSDGNYGCSVTSRRPAYHDSCTTRLRVSREFAFIATMDAAAATAGFA